MTRCSCIRRAGCGHDELDYRTYDEITTNWAIVRLSDEKVRLEAMINVQKKLKGLPAQNRRKHRQVCKAIRILKAHERDGDR